ncbi:MAG: tRNA uridine-5-carboxymethylaminomethyl(34) synthesis enzyme MnmG [Deltaproteobacteria bacterium]|nr:tRNA uridine-5-carboxymethylaminomethyl(34) synthesis enzyme MnmG [Deltaproteobacteria bacterium]
MNRLQMPERKEDFDVIVVGGGHAGCEAYAAACRVGARTALVIPSLKEAACQPCNPAVGGPGKGHLVREVVALGGLMGLVTDLSGIQFRTLNFKKGPAVRATRVQTDSGIYIQNMVAQLKGIELGDIIEDRVIGITWTSLGGGRRITGVELLSHGSLRARRVVVATGTFLRGKLFVGDQVTQGGRQGAPAAVRLACSLEEMGLPLIRLKTGTCPRLDGKTIVTDNLEPQVSDTPEPFFSPETKSPALPQRTCYLTYTGESAHDVVRRNLETSAMYSGAISGIGPRYCPSFETKIERFPDKGRHQVFLEPEDRHGSVIYPSGLSTSLPPEVQEELVHAIPGLEQARIVRYGYAVEYDAVQPRVLSPSMEVDGIKGLFLAGQILGTSGYEEAAALGLLAGANAALSARGDTPVVLARDQAYAGVMVDDLTTRGVDEPYRMFTSRSEYRLLLREDNADERLLEEGLRTNLLPVKRAELIRKKLELVKEATRRLRETQLTPSTATNTRLENEGLPRISKVVSLLEMLRRGGIQSIDLAAIAPWINDLPDVVRARIEVDVKYEGYLDRQKAHAEQLRHVDQVRLPSGIEFDKIPGLRAEVVEKLNAVRPANLGQVSRIPGITPAAVQILHVWCERMRGED